MAEVLTGILVLLMAAAVSAFVGMGIAQSRRRRKLAGLAHQLEMKFAPEDPFDIPRRYMDFGLIRSGHSPRAYNILYARREGLVVRLFDYRYEIGHGTRRLTRHYVVLVVESNAWQPNVVLWHQADAEGAPLETRQVDGHVGQWSYRGADARACELAQACQELSDLNVSIETHDNAVLFCRPVSGSREAPGQILQPALTAVKHLDALRSEKTPEESGESGD